MLKIGEFSLLSQVTVKTLHHYDEIGLFKPASIDKFTGYRYYSVEQLPRIHRIMAFKELGLSLEQIAQMLSDELSREEIRGMLRLQRAELQQRVRAEQERLAQVEFRLRMIEIEDEMPELDVIVKQIPAIRALTIRTSVSQENLIQNLLTGQREIEQALAQRKIKLTGPLTEIYYAEEFQINFQDVEMVHPVDDAQTGDVPLETVGTLKLRTVSGLPMAATYVQRGVSPPGTDTPQISEIMAILQRWIVDNGYKLCGTHRIVHHFGPLEHAEYEEWITEYQHEIELAG
jgi:DNA-binding transcriptional MerR regulator